MFSPCRNYSTFWRSQNQERNMSLSQDWSSLYVVYVCLVSFFLSSCISHCSLLTTVWKGIVPYAGRVLVDPISRADMKILSLSERGQGGQGCIQMQHSSAPKRDLQHRRSHMEVCQVLKLNISNYCLMPNANKTIFS